VHFALGTNKLSSIMGTLMASWRYYKNKHVDLALCVPSMAAAFFGSGIGASLTLMAGDVFLQRLLLVVLPVTAFYVFRKKNFDEDIMPLSRRWAVIVAAFISFFIGIYDGFFGPGTGAFLILLYNGLARIGARVATGNAKFVNLASNLSALVIFFLNGRVLIPLGLAAAFFSILGAYIGSGIVIYRGTKIIRYAILKVI
jgi:uncharacterized membrane protein YfcA